MNLMSFFRATLGGIAAFLATPLLLAQPAYPSAPIRIVVPFAAATSVDVVARMYGQRLAEEMRATVLVENRAGAGSMLGTAHVAHAKPDGYTLLAGSNSAFTIAPHIYAKIDYDPEKDFRLLGPLFTTASVLMVGKDVPVNSLGGLLEMVRNKPGAVAYGSYGIGTIPHLMMEMLLDKTKLEMIHVPYKGGVEVGQALVSGQLPVGFETVPTASVRAKSGQAKALAVFSENRAAMMPDTPSTAELGYADVNIFGLVGLFAPAAIPEAVARRIQEAHAKVVSAPDFADKLRQIGAEPLTLSAEQLTQSMRSESRRVRDVVTKAKIKAQ